MATPQGEIYEIFCFFLGDADCFPIEIAKNERVDKLKKLIKKDWEHKLAKAKVDAGDLQLYHVEIEGGATMREEVIRKMSEEKPAPLNAIEKLANIFPSYPNEDNIHIIIDFPPARRKGKAEIEPNSARKRLLKTVLLNSGSRLESSSSGSSLVFATDALVQREKTIHVLYEMLFKRKLIQVRGTPASGKTSLAKLLVVDIEKREPDANLVWVASWPNNGQPWQSRLKALGWKKNGPNIVVIDEAHKTYDDESFWNDYIKNVPSLVLKQRVVMFTSYGRPTQTVTETSAHVLINGHQRVGLRPSKAQGDSHAAGSIFKLTASHIGASEDVLRIVEAHEPYNNQKPPKKYTWATFVENISVKELFDSLEGGSIFRRGLPLWKDLGNTSIAHVFRTVLSENYVQMSNFDSQRQADLEFCFRKGWLHTEKLSEAEEIAYVFTSPLHQWFIEYRLGTEFQTAKIEERNLLEFCIEVIGRYSPTQLSAKRFGASFSQRTPEAQYQDEFYRCFHAYTGGSLVSFPEVSPGTGRIDFYIPSKNWGVELVRDGKDLENHSSRFSAGGTYTKLFAMDDYIILDFRTNHPRKAHPQISNLYHVVFNDDFTTAKILNNVLNTQKETALLNFA